MEEANLEEQQDQFHRLRSVSSDSVELAWSGDSVKDYSDDFHFYSTNATV